MRLIPLDGRRRRVPVQHHRGAAIVPAPTVAHRQAELVGLPRRLAYSAKARTRPDALPWYASLSPAWATTSRPSSSTRCEDEAVAEFADLVTERLGLARELRERLLEAVGDRDVLARERALELVPRGCRGTASACPALTIPIASRSTPTTSGPPIDEVAEEDRPSPLGMRGVDRAARFVPLELVAEPSEQRLELGEAAVHIADRVEGPLVAAPIGEERFGGRPTASATSSTEWRTCTRPEAPLGRARASPAAADRCAASRRSPGSGDRCARAFRSAPMLVGRVEHDRDRQDVVRPREVDEALPRLRLDARRVDHREQPCVEALAGDEVERLECGGRRGLVLLVVRHHPAEGVARQHLVRREVRPRERRLAPSRRRR